MVTVAHGTFFGDGSFEMFLMSIFFEHGFSVTHHFFSWDSGIVLGHICYAAFTRFLWGHNHRPIFYCAATKSDFAEHGGWLGIFSFPPRAQGRCPDSHVWNLTRPSRRGSDLGETPEFLTEDSGWGHCSWFVRSQDISSTTMAAVVGRSIGSPASTPRPDWKPSVHRTWQISVGRFLSMWWD